MQHLLVNEALGLVKTFYRHGRYEVTSRTRTRDVLIPVDPETLVRALHGWHAQMVADDEGLAGSRRDG